MTVFAKDADSVTDYSIDWSAWLTAGETITDAQWSIAPAAGVNGPVLSGPVQAGTQTGIHVSGGNTGDRYRLTCRVTTDTGRVVDRSLSLMIMER